jgi:hypothetical protein
MEDFVYHTTTFLKSFGVASPGTIVFLPAGSLVVVAVLLLVVQHFL